MFCGEGVGAAGEIGRWWCSAVTYVDGWLLLLLLLLLLILILREQIHAIPTSDRVFMRVQARGCGWERDSNSNSSLTVTVTGWVRDVENQERVEHEEEKRLFHSAVEARDPWRYWMDSLPCTLRYLGFDALARAPDMGAVTDRWRCLWLEGLRILPDGVNLPGLSIAAPRGPRSSCPMEGWCIYIPVS